MIEFKNRTDKGDYKVLHRVDVPHHAKCGTRLVQYTFCGECGNLLQPLDTEKIFDNFKKLVTDL